MPKVFDFSFTEGYWIRSFRVVTPDDNVYKVMEWYEDSVKVTNMGNAYEFLDKEDLEGVEQMLCWAFEYRGQRRDSRDTCVPVDLENLFPPE